MTTTRIRFTRSLLLGSLTFLLAGTAFGGDIGRRFPSEKKVVLDPVTGTPLTFLTSAPVGDSKIYQTHPQWTSDAKWLVFRSNRAKGQAFAVNEETGDIVQLTDKGYAGMLCVAQKSMKLYLMRDLGAAEPGLLPEAPRDAKDKKPHDEKKAPAPRREPKGPFQIIETDLAKLFADSAAGTLQPASAYERVCATLPDGLIAGSDMALDATEEVAYVRVSGGDVGTHLAPGTKLEKNYGPRNMGAGPAGLRSVNLKTGELKVVVDVPFQIGHVQSNPFVPGEIVFCWETGGKSPQRMWTVKADGSGLRPLYPEPSYDWITHEAVITKDEVAFAILGHRKPGFKDDWGVCGSRDHATGLAIVNLRTNEVLIAGQTASGSGFWHVNGSADGRWVAGDDFGRNIYLIDRHTREMLLLSAGHKETAADHPHPTFSPDGTKIEIQSAMLSADGRSMNICIIPVPKSWLARSYAQKAPQ